MCHQVILIVNKMQRLFIQLKMNYSALIVNRSGRTVLNRLRHIINIDIITEHFTGAAIFRRDWCTGETYVCSVRKAVPDNTGSANDGLRFHLAVFLLPNHNFLCQSVLAAVRLICHDDNIPALGKRLVAFLKLLHSRKNDAVCLSVCKQFFQMGAALGMLWSLAQEILATGELTVKLIIQVIPICNDHNSWAFQRFLQIVGIEHHRQRFPTTLRVPKHAAFSICDSGMLGGFDCFLYSEILMVGGKHLECLLAVHVEADKVFQNVKKTIFLKYTFKEGVELSVLGVLIASVRCFPLHITIFAGGKRSGF